MLTIKDIKKILSQIENSRNDNEFAHIIQDSLYVEVLTAISMGARNPKLLALEALKIEEIEFSRWMA